LHGTVDNRKGAIKIVFKSTGSIAGSTMHRTEYIGLAERRLGHMENGTTDSASSTYTVPVSYKAIEAVGIPVLMTRRKDGQVRAFLIVCSHRGALVAADGCGEASRFVCP
jgi:hypothetical protein